MEDRQNLAAADPAVLAYLDSQVHSSKQPEIDLVPGLDGSYSVHPDSLIETATPLERTFRHSGWQSARTKIWRALIRTGATGTALQSFSQCGSGCWVQWSPTSGKSRLSSNTCHHRWCRPCAAARAQRIRMSVEEQLRDWSRVRFVTLTLKHRRASLKEQLDRLYNCFAILRRKPMWKNAVKGSAAFCEVKLSERDGCWHPHLHIVCVGSWLDTRELSRTWLAVTGDSSIVNIQEARGGKDVVGYITKYCTKVVDSSILEVDDKLDEAIVSLRGRRLVNGHGVLSKITDRSATDAMAADGPWHTIGRLDELVRDAHDGDRDALRIIRSLQIRNVGLDDELSHVPRPPPR